LFERVAVAVRTGGDVDAFAGQKDEQPTVLTLFRYGRAGRAVALMPTPVTLVLSSWSAHMANSDAASTMWAALSSSSEAIPVSGPL
jgi:hypothetical protein